MKTAQVKHSFKLLFFYADNVNGLQRIISQNKNHADHRYLYNGYIAIDRY